MFHIVNKDEYLSRLQVRLAAVLDDPSYHNARHQLRSKDLLLALSPEEAVQIRYDYKPERLARTATFAFDAASRLLIEDRSVEQHTSALYDAAEVFEHLRGVAEGPDVNTSRLLSAALYQLAGFQANSICLMREADPPPLPTSLLPAAVTDLVHRWTHLVLERRFVRTLWETRQIALRFGGAAFRGVEGPHHSDSAITLPLIRAVTDGFADFLGYVLRGSNDCISSTHEKLQFLLDVFARTGQANDHLLLRVLQVLFETISRNSTWRLLPQNDPLWGRYTMLLARGQATRPLEARGVAELWRSQQVALASGLLGKGRGLVVKMPTGAGKTRIAEIAIMQALAAGARAVYVAPFRALSDEVERSMSTTFSGLGFSVSSVMGSFEADAFEDYLLNETDLLITTPEKLNLVSRARPEFFADVKLLILDEGHVIDDEDRGGRYELLLTRLKSRMPADARILFISAVMPDANAAEFAEWLCGDPNAITATAWRPSRQLLGLFTWRGDTGQISYPELRQRETAAPFVPHAIRTTAYRDFTPKTRREKAVQFPAHTKGETAAELALRFTEFGPVLLFAPRPDWAESCAKAILRGLTLRRQTEGMTVPTSFEYIDRYVQHCASVEAAASWLGEGSLIHQLLRSGIAIHHRGIPEVLRRSIEQDFREGIFPILVATNTLGQGVNLPVKTVIVHSVARYVPEQDGQEGHPETINQRDFWNICGRAGRAGVETEGQIIFVALNADDEATFQEYKKRQFEPIEGRLFAALKDLIRERLTDEEFARHLDSELLTVLLEEVVGTSVEERVAEILGHSLVSIQARRNSYPLEPLVEVSQRTAIQIRDRIVDEGTMKVFSLTGLRVSSCEALLEQIQAAGDELRLLLVDPEPSLDNLVETVYRHVCSLSQMQPQYPIGVDYLSLLTDWVNQTPIGELASEYGSDSGDDQRLTRFLEDFFGFRLPWALAAS